MAIELEMPTAAELCNAIDFEGIDNSPMPGFDWLVEAIEDMPTCQIFRSGISGFEGKGIPFDLLYRMASSLDIIDLYASHDGFKEYIDSRGGLLKLVNVLRSCVHDSFNPTSSESECKSPIEATFLSSCHSRKIDPVCQFQCGAYRLDFAFPDCRVCVELDGHDFHKTKEQRTHDASRERWLQLNDWRVIRFTGTEIHRNVSACVDQTIQFLSKVREQRSHGSHSPTGGAA